MKKQHTRMLHLIAAGIVPSVAVTLSLLPTYAPAAPGDLDPSFGDVGRLGPILNAPAWSVEPLDDGSMFLGGGRPGGYIFDDGDYVPTNFVSLLSATGATADSFAAAAIDGIQVLDVVRQPDGQVVAVGRRQSGTHFSVWQLAVFRLQPEGSLDGSFADQGIFALATDEYGERQFATSVVLDPDGRIVVAGTRDSRLMVLRLLPDGSLDSSFGESGIAAGPDNWDGDSSGARTSILRTKSGGYRLTASNAAGCQLVALTASGAVDGTFGRAGIATAEPLSGDDTFCQSVAMETNERLVVVGRTAAHGFATRVLANGQPDAGFSGAAVADALTDATAVAVGADGKIVVAGRHVNGGAVMRLKASGELDRPFGNQGVTIIDLHSNFFGSSPVTHDMKIGADGSLVAAGGWLSNGVGPYGGAVVVRLLSDNDGGSPGVLGIVERETVTASEGSELTVSVRRTGGSSGLVSVEYEISKDAGTDATIGTDLKADTRRLTWADGDMVSQEIRIPILADDLIEGDEYFAVGLRDVQGGAGLGQEMAHAQIAPDGAPHGQISIDDSMFAVGEGEAIEIGVNRQWYSEGDVSVTLTPIADTAAAGNDFAGDPVTLTWTSGEKRRKLVTIPITDDDDEEADERFMVELSDPTGGAILAAQSTAEVIIAASDQPLPPPPPPTSGGGGGGGALGFLSLLLLGAASLVRRAIRAGRAT